MVSEAREPDMEIDYGEFNRENDEEVHSRAYWTGGCQLDGRNGQRIINWNERQKADHPRGHRAEAVAAGFARSRASEPEQSSHYARKDYCPDGRQRWPFGDCTGACFRIYDGCRQR